MNKRLLFAVFFGYGLITNVLAETKEASDVFGKWVYWQYAYQDRDITEAQKTLKTNSWRTFKKTSFRQTTLKDQVSALFDFPDATTRRFLPSKRRMTFSNFYSCFNHDVQGFLDHLKARNFATKAVEKEEKKVSIFDTIDKYKAFMKSFFKHIDDEKLQNEYLFGTANRLFEFCFDEKTFPYFNELLEKPEFHPIARFLYSVVWYHLVGEGWKDWHQNCLDGLKKEHDQGKRITYVAGGNDVYQLLKHGIYNIDIIDPMLPSQPDYYAEGWLWLIKQNGLGDKINFDFGDKSVVMKRTAYKEYELFDAALSTGDNVKIRHSKTTWKVCDKKNKKLGTIVIDRRFAHQADFYTNPKKALLLSFNEMYFVDAPKSFGGWGIDTSVVKPDTSVYVKQLRKPITQSLWTRLRKADDAPFSFILLGSCAT